MGKITKKYQAEMLRRIYSIGLIAFALTPIAAICCIDQRQWSVSSTCSRV